MGENFAPNLKGSAPAAEKKDDVSVTVVYKIDCSCDGCAMKVKKALRHFDGVGEVKIDSGANKLTVEGTNIDPMAIREKLEKRIKKKFELVSPQPKKDSGSGSGSGSSDKKLEDKKAEKKEESNVAFGMGESTLLLASRFIGM